MGFLDRIKQTINKTKYSINKSINKTKISILKTARSVIKNVYFNISKLEDDIKYDIKKTEETTKWEGTISYQNKDFVEIEERLQERELLIKQIEILEPYTR